MILLTLALAPLSLRVCVVSKIILDTIRGTQHLGGGGVQAAVGVRLAAPESAQCVLVAPVGTDFDDAALDGLRHDYGVDATVEPLAHVPTTPGEVIRYEGEEMLWEPHGWEGWADLCEWQPVLPAADAYHVIVEGGGDGEVRAVETAMAVAAGSGWQTAPPGERPLLSIEPVMHEVTRASVESLARLSAHADVVSPDLLTATRMARCFADVAARLGPSVTGEAVNGAEPPRSRRALGVIARGCARALRLRPTATLAIRDGARGSYLWSPRDGRLSHAPAVADTEVVDPTGAGNAYAGALCAALAGDMPADEAAGVASAVGAAFVGVDGWPALERSGWVAARAAEARGEREIEAQVRAFARSANIYLG